MRRVFSSLIVMISALACSLSAGIKAPIEPSLEAALAKSRATGRPVIADFHALY